MPTKYGDFDFGFDFYERQGQYFQMEYAAPRVGIIQNLNLEAKLANDVRIVRDGDLVSQWVLPASYTNNDYQRMTQFAWYYKVDTTLATNGISANLKFEDLNDPFFISKYSVRTYFDGAETIDWTTFIDPYMLFCVTLHCSNL